jgi:hypothetical protein
MKPSMPNFVKLKEGQFIEGIFVCAGSSMMGKTYKFADANGEIFTLGGNRVQLDQLFDEFLGNPKPLTGDDTLIGHFLIVERLQDVHSKSSDHMIAQYQIGHDIRRCPKEQKK